MKKNPLSEDKTSLDFVSLIAVLEMDHKIDHFHFIVQIFYFFFITILYTIKWIISIPSGMERNAIPTCLILRFNIVLMIFATKIEIMEMIDKFV